MENGRGRALIRMAKRRPKGLKRDVPIRIWKANVLGMLLGYEWKLHIAYTGMFLHEITWMECSDTHMFLTLTLGVLV